MAKRGPAQGRTRQARPRSKSAKNGATVGYEAQLWEMADALRGSMDAAEYKHVALGLIFLKYISDAFEERHAELIGERGQGADPEDPDEYRMKNIFWVPPEARWQHLKVQARQPTIGQLVDDAMAAIERDNPGLKGVLPKEYARPGLDKQRLGQLIDLVSNVRIGDRESRSKDVLGRVYEYFLAQFASAEGKKGGEFFTPRSVVRLLVEMIEPYKGRVYDPCCGSSGMFVQSEEFIAAHGGRLSDISIFGQESNYTTWRLAKMNLAIRGIEGQIAPGDTFLNDRHPDLKADYILANPPFNVSDWGAERLKDDKRWRYGLPPAGNANFAWVQHIVDHLAPKGIAGFVLANSSTSSVQLTDLTIRRNLVEADLIDCMVALPGHLFYSMYSQVCLWFIARDKRPTGQRNRRGETLFIDARNLGVLVERTHRELTELDIARIVAAYHSWTGRAEEQEYRDQPGFCRSVSIQEVRDRNYNLTPGRYVTSERTESQFDADARMRKAAHVLHDLLLNVSERHGQFLNACTSLGIALEPPKESNVSDLSLTALSGNLADAAPVFAQVIFESWFVDFQPVYARASRKAIALGADILAMFPTGFEDSPLGEIPKGWQVTTYGDVLHPVNERIGEEEAPEYSATVRGLELRSLRFNKALARARGNNKRVRMNDLVFGLSRKTLNFGLMTGQVGSVSPVYEIFRIDSTKYLPELLELHIRHHMESHMDILKPGAREGQPIDRDYLLSKEVMVPPMSVQTAFAEIALGKRLNA